MQRPVLGLDAKGQLERPHGAPAIKPCIGFAQASAGMLYSSVRTDAVWWMTWLGWL